MEGRPRRRVSASRSRETSRRVRNATIGTHVRRVGEPTARTDRGGDFAFSSHRRAQRAERGVIEHLAPRSASRESEAAYARRTSRRGFAEDIQHRSRIRRIVFVLVSLVVLVCVAGGAAACAYVGSVSDRMGLGDSNATEALSAPAEGQVPCTLLVGEFSEPGVAYDGPDTLIVARVDEAAARLSLLSVSSDLQVVLSDGEVHRLREAQMLGGDAALIEAVEGATGISLSHIVKLDSAALVSLVDELGGITVDVPEEVDDPNAGSLYIPAGENTLDGQGALTLVRAVNYEGAGEVRDANQRAVVTALAERLCERDALGTIGLLDAVSGTVRTDYSVTDALSLIGAFRAADWAGVYSVRMPGSQYTSTATDIEYFVSDDEAWEAMAEAFTAGKDPALQEETAPEIDRASFEIEVQNGTTTVGAAQRMTDLLTEGGFTVVETGNAEQPIYEETLIVYADDKNLEAAEAVCSYLETGRVIPSLGYYAFETDVLVVLGADWQPIV